MNKILKSLLVCPQCKGNLHYCEVKQELICLSEGLGYPIQDDIPVMLLSEARHLTLEEVEAFKKS